MRTLTGSFRRNESIALLFAILIAAVLAGVAFYVPLYASGGTLVDVNGSYAAIVAGLPLVLALATMISLALRGRDATAGPMAWTLTIVCGLLSLVSILSIGIFIVPVVGCLIFACAVHGREAGEGLKWSMKRPF